MVSNGFRKWKNKATVVRCLACCACAYLCYSLFRSFYQAITADKIADNSALRRTFTAWISALPRKQDAVEADGHYARTVLGTFAQGTSEAKAEVLVRFRRRRTSKVEVHVESESEASSSRVSYCG